MVEDLGAIDLLRHIALKDDSELTIRLQQDLDHAVGKITQTQQRQKKRAIIDVGPEVSYAGNHVLLQLRHQFLETINKRLEEYGAPAFTEEVEFYVEDDVVIYAPIECRLIKKFAVNGCLHSRLLSRHCNNPKLKPKPRFTFY